MAGRSNARPVEDHTFTAQDKLVLDANVWLFLYCPHGDPHDYRVTVFSQAFKRIVEARSVIYIDAAILGEFINRFARLVHGLLLDKDAAPKDFKNFRKSPRFKLVAQSITAACRKILQQARPLESGFTKLDLAQALTDYETGQHDFTDLLITDFCRSNDLTLITDDADFVERNVKLLTTKDRLA